MDCLYWERTILIKQNEGADKLRKGDQLDSEGQLKTKLKRTHICFVIVPSLVKVPMQRISNTNNVIVVVTK